MQGAGIKISTHAGADFCAGLQPALLIAAGPYLRAQSRIIRSDTLRPGPDTHDRPGSETVTAKDVLIVVTTFDRPTANKRRIVNRKIYKL